MLTILTMSEWMPAKERGAFGQGSNENVPRSTVVTAPQVCDYTEGHRTYTFDDCVVCYVISISVKS